jgi:predicted MarR family transcription regulator
VAAIPKRDFGFASARPRVFELDLSFAFYMLNANEMTGFCVDMTDHPNPKRRIVSSRHLADGDNWEASEVEYGMIIAYNAFSRWMTRCMSAAGNTDLTPLEILVLHNTNHRGRDKRLTDICFLLNIEDTHTVNYALRKLLKMELLSSEKRGKEVFYGTSPAGAALCDAYRDVRERCFLDGLSRLDMTGEEMRDIAASLRALSGQYDQASRAAASL